MDVKKLLIRIYAISWFAWQELSNWTKPWIFVLYTLVRPLSTLLLYAYIYIAFAVASGQANPTAAFYMITGIAFYNYIGNGLYGIIWVIHEEREHYEILKYNYVSYPSLQGYLVCRGIIYYILGFFLTIIVLALGLPLVGYDLTNLKPNLAVFTIVMLLGFIWCTSLSIFTASLSLFSSEYGPLISEGMGGLLFLTGNVLFPAEKLPPWLHPISEMLPMKEWMDLARYSMNVDYAINTPALMASLIAKTIIYVVFCTLFSKMMDRLVRKIGALEATTAH